MRIKEDRHGIHYWWRTCLGIEQWKQRISSGLAWAGFSSALTAVTVLNIEPGG
ncbi:MAG: hypothetical protein U0074_08435 [Kouleothrix sp.]